MQRAERDGLLDELRRLCDRPLEPIATSVEPRLRRLAGVGAVIFDVYGTLLISGSGDVGSLAEASRESAAADALRSLGVDGSSSDLGRELTTRLLTAIEASHRESRARGVEHPEIDIVEVWHSALPPMLGREPTDDELRRFAIAYECRANPTWPMPGAAEIVRALRERPMPLGIASNAQFFTPLLLEAQLGASVEALGFAPRLCAWSWALGVAKPALTLFEPLLEALRSDHGIRPENALYVGNDQRNDVWTAARLGMRTALFAGDARSYRPRLDDERARAHEADVVITELRQILEVIEG